MAQWNAASPTLLPLIRRSFAVLSVAERTRKSKFSKMKYRR